MDASWKLAMDNEGIAHSVAAKLGKLKFYQKIGDPSTDMKQEAIIGLYLACKQYPDAEKANWRKIVCRAVRCHLWEKCCDLGLIRVPQYAGERRKKTFLPECITDEEPYRELADREHWDGKEVDCTYLFVGLTRRQKDILRMHYVENARKIDIAKHFGITKGGLFSSIQCAIAAIRRNQGGTLSAIGSGGESGGQGTASRDCFPTAL